MDTGKIKEPNTTYPIHSILYHRWSPRAYAETRVENDKLQRIFEAARWAPSSSNQQPWHFLVGFKGDDVYTAIFESLVEFNQLWVKTAPILCLAICKKTTTKGELNAYRDYDLGQAVAHLTFQASAEGVYVHQMGGFDRQKAAMSLEIPEEYEVRTAFTLGYPGDPEVLHPNLKKMEYTERSRRLASESVFTGKFGDKASFL